MLKTRAQYVPWSPRQPLQTLNSTRAQASKGRLCTSTLTEPVQLATYFKNGNAVTGGVCSGSRTSLGMPAEQEPARQWCADLGSRGLQDQATFTALKRRR